MAVENNEKFETWHLTDSGKKKIFKQLKKTTGWQLESFEGPIHKIENGISLFKKLKNE